MQAVSYPPQVTHSRTPIPPPKALELLQTFLSDTESSPHLHPDAILTEQGPQRATAGEGLTLHNLRRVEAGLRGERLGKDLSDFNTAEGAMEQLGDGYGDDTTNRKDTGSRKRAKMEQTDGGQWRDLGDYQREQRDDVGDLVGDESMPTAVDKPKVPRITEDPNHDAGEGIDKEERKRRKKERRTKEKRDVEEKRKKQKQMDQD